MSPEEYARFDAVGLADLVRRGEVTPRELVEAAIASIELVNPRLNAVTRLMGDASERTLAAGPSDGPLRGVPMLVKDEFEIAGTIATRGSVLLRDRRATATTEVIKRLEAAGLIFVGRTNMPEFGLLPFTEPQLAGPTSNPWNPAFSPGGSSGGSAAAVAAGIVPIANGGDGGGSIRIPASACGVFGLKPSRGRNPARQPGYDTGLTVHHVLTRTVRDSAAVLDATCGPRPGELFVLPKPERTYAKAIESDPPALRIALSTRDFSNRTAHSDCVAAVEEMGGRLSELGHTVVEARPSIEGTAYYEAFKLRWCQGAGAVLKAAQRALCAQPEIPSPIRGLLQYGPFFELFLNLYRRDGMPLVERFTRRLGGIDARHAPSDLLLANQVLKQAELTMVRFFDRYDIYLTPTLAEPPQRTGGFRGDRPLRETEELLLRYVGYTPIANTGGFPAMSVPTGWNDDGLPIGTQFIAPLRGEDRLLQLAAQHERAFPLTRRPLVRVDSH